MNYLLKLLFLLVLFLKVGLFSSSAQKKPNLLYIITDEHNFRTIGAYRELLSKEEAFMWGSTVVETPNLDYLAHNGAILTSMYAASPSCTPSRAAMFTGSYPHTVKMPKNGYVLDHNIATLADVLVENGYETGYTGKLHLIGHPKPNWSPEYSYGFQHKKYMFNGGHWKKFELDNLGNPKVGSVNAKGEPNTKLNGADEKSFATDWLTDRALEFIDSKKDSKAPFFQVISFPDPHTNNTVRAPYDTMYNSKDIELPKTFSLTFDTDKPGWWNPELDFAANKKSNKKKKKDENEHTDSGKFKKGYTPEKIKTKLKSDITQYFGMVKCIDDNIGKIIHRLKKNGQLENTIIIFSSDHGDLLGEYGRDNKGVPQEGSAKIPFIVYYPNLIKPGTIVNKAANNTDLMDTALALMDVTDFDPNTTEGRDISPWLLGKEKESLEDITFVTYQWWTAVITDRYKLILDKGMTKPWLIDLEKNPDELTNFIDDQAYQPIVKKLAKALKEYGKKHKDPVVLDAKINSQLNKLI
ncbi:sulfatase family protein [Wenyingzhuangia aestuarii]|uniref:sulfatase family protein n=1 Tax=Wenyingzhuangia aestuarii TaxID=1647582 RepID=UPI00143BA670|nr:sulfatase [Wenyingzhuangia aestuarii]NJB83400.1 putative sulfatase [Wenyingzhuangia aestuarii]